MSNEETPLLQSEHDIIYDRFPKKKQYLVMIVSWGGLVTRELFPLIFHGAVLVIL